MVKFNTHVYRSPTSLRMNYHTTSCDYIFDKQNQEGCLTKDLIFTFNHLRLSTKMFDLSVFVIFYILHLSSPSYTLRIHDSGYSIPSTPTQKYSGSSSVNSLTLFRPFEFLWYSFLLIHVSRVWLGPLVEFPSTSV